MFLTRVAVLGAIVLLGVVVEATRLSASGAPEAAVVFSLGPIGFGKSTFSEKLAEELNKKKPNSAVHIDGDLLFFAPSKLGGPKLDEEEKHGRPNEENFAAEVVAGMKAERAAYSFFALLAALRKGKTVIFSTGGGVFFGKGGLAYVRKTIKNALNINVHVVAALPGSYESATGHDVRAVYQSKKVVDAVLYRLAHKKAGWEELPPKYSSNEEFAEFIFGLSKKNLRFAEQLQREADSVVYFRSAKAEWDDVGPISMPTYTKLATKIAQNLDEKLAKKSLDPMGRLNVFQTRVLARFNDSSISTSPAGSDVAPKWITGHITLEYGKHSVVLPPSRRRVDANDWPQNHKTEAPAATTAQKFAQDEIFPEEEFLPTTFPAFLVTLTKRNAGLPSSNPDIWAQVRVVVIPDGDNWPRELSGQSAGWKYFGGSFSEHPKNKTPFFAHMTVDAGPHAAKDMRLVAEAFVNRAPWVTIPYKNVTTPYGDNGGGVSGITYSMNIREARADPVSLELLGRYSLPVGVN